MLIYIIVYRLVTFQWQEQSHFNLWQFKIIALFKMQGKLASLVDQCAWQYVSICQLAALRTTCLSPHQGPRPMRSLQQAIDLG